MSSDSASNVFEQISAQTAYDLIQKDEAILIDVREYDEFSDRHIANAVSVPLSGLSTQLDKLLIAEHKTIIFQCLKGGRGNQACEKAKKMGLPADKIVNLEGGITAWQNEKLPLVGKSITELDDPNQISIFRQVQITIGFLIAFCTFVGFTNNTNAFLICGVLGAALFFSGLTGWCGLGALLSKMPWNKP